MPRYWQQISDAEVARRAQERRRHAEQARGTLDKTLFLPLFEVVFLNPCDWTHRLRSVVAATDAESAVRSFLCGERSVDRRDVVGVHDVTVPRWCRNAAVARGATGCRPSPA